MMRERKVIQGPCALSLFFYAEVLSERVKFIFIPLSSRQVP